jgi:hypothetical protein
MDARVGHVEISRPQHRHLTPARNVPRRSPFYVVAASIAAICRQGLARSNCSARSSNSSSASGVPINCNPTGKLFEGTGAGTTIAGSPARLIAVENVAAVRGVATCPAMGEG